MPVITIDKKYLFSLLGSGTDEKMLKEHAAKLGFEIESPSDKELLLEVTPNRLDLLDAVGLARAIKNFTHRSNSFNYSIAKEAEVAFTITVHPSVKRVFPFIAGVVAEGLDLGEAELLDLINFAEKFCATYGRNRRKIAIGMHNIDAMKPPLTYRCGSDGKFVHLGSTEARLYSEILDSTKQGEAYSGIVRKGKVCHYPELMDSEGTIAFIPIINSERTKITVNTKNMFVDITGTSEYAVNKSADLIAAIFMDMGARVRRVNVDYGAHQVHTPELQERYISVPLRRMESEIGVQIGFNNVISLANKMGYEAALVGRNIRFRVPEYRLDVIGEQDIVEDIAIGYGYDYIRPIQIAYTQQGGLEEQTSFARKVGEAMVGLGFSELANSYLTNENINFDRPGLERDESAVILKNPKTEAISMLRTWLLPSILKDLGMSTHDKLPQSAYEIDMVFRLKEEAPSESYSLGGATIDPKKNFNDVKAEIGGLMGALGIAHSISHYRHPSFIEGRCAEIKVGNVHTGFFGELHPKVLREFGIEEPGTAFEIELEKLQKAR